MSNEKICDFWLIISTAVDELWLDMAEFVFLPLKMNSILNLFQMLTAC